VCGGEVTEPGYFNGLKQAYRNAAVQVCVKTKGVDPASLVSYAASVQAMHPDTFDEVWCVVDVDEFDLAAAKQLAADLDVQLAVSNPCFEVWLLLHFAQCRAAVQSPTAAIRKLKQHVPDYSKSSFRFSRFKLGVNDAIVRAQVLGEAGEEHATNPSSGVWKVARIIAAAQ
jgi:hypothetical protein